MGVKKVGILVSTEKNNKTRRARMYNKAGRRCICGVLCACRCKVGCMCNIYLIGEDNNILYLCYIIKGMQAPTA